MAKYSNIEFDRKRFEEALNFYKPFGLAPQYSSLRFEAEFEKGKTVYEFLANAKATFATERYLKQNDLLVVKSLQIGYIVELDSKPGHAPVMYSPLLQSLAIPSGYQGLANSDIEAFYNGSFVEVITGQTSNISSFPMDEFRVVPQAQPYSIVNPAGDALVSAGVIPQWNADDVMVNLPERVVFSGSQDQKLRITMPAASSETDIKAAAGYSVRMVITIKGWLVEGGATKKFSEMQNSPYYGII